MFTIQLNDLLGDYWDMELIACQLDKRDGMWYCLWNISEGPVALKNYDIIPTPVFTEWWS